VLVFSAAWCLLVVLIAVFAPLSAPYDPSHTGNLAAGQGPSAQHRSGADPTTVGTILAVAGAWLGGWFGHVLPRAFAIVFAFPALLLAVLAVVFSVLTVVLFGSGLLRRSSLSRSPPPRTTPASYDPPRCASATFPASIRSVRLDSPAGGSACVTSFPTA
jgi:ABC-type dipeptide/oligopeptide/nickel transport system permease subunit